LFEAYKNNKRGQQPSENKRNEKVLNPAAFHNYKNSKTCNMVVWKITPGSKIRKHVEDLKRIPEA
jgi:hypothetical protein